MFDNYNVIDAAGLRQRSKPPGVAEALKARPRVRTVAVMGIHARTFGN
jgi:hypothetical protein